MLQNVIWGHIELLFRFTHAGINIGKVKKRLLVDWVVLIIGCFNLLLICHILVAKLTYFKNRSLSFWAFRDHRKTCFLQNNLLKRKE